MSGPPEQQPQSNPQPSSGRPKATLEEFIKIHSQLITGIAAFIALTVFSSQLNNNEIKVYFSALTFLAAVLLSLELLLAFPPPPLHWRLEIFSVALGGLVFMMGWYWFTQFPLVWVPLTGLFVQSLVLFGLAALLKHFAMKAVKFVAARIFGKELQANQTLHGVTVSQLMFLGCSLLVFVSLFWTFHKLGGRTIPTPNPPGQSAIGK